MSTFTGFISGFNCETQVQILKPNPCLLFFFFSHDCAIQDTKKLSNDGAEVGLFHVEHLLRDNSFPEAQSLHLSHVHEKF